MWVFLSDCFLSIVHKDCKKDELLVRARRSGDIEKIFPTAKVTRYTKSDYLFRAVVKRKEVAEAMSTELFSIEYDNFKDTIDDKALHDAALEVWVAMARLQPLPPYSGMRRPRRRR